MYTCVRICMHMQGGDGMLQDTSLALGNIRLSLLLKLQAKQIWNAAKGAHVSNEL